MTSKRPIASVSLDLDNQWSYMRTHGDPGWETYPSYLDTLVPRVVDFLAALDLKATIFVVGQDAALEKNHAALRRLALAGHEIGSHSFRHEPWLHLYSDEEMERELVSAEESIVAATGVRPRGFRGPGFSFSPATLRILKQRDYLYDTSTFPTFIGPLARMYYFFKSSLSSQERAQRKELFGGAANGFLPLGAYRWKLAAGELLELPVTTFPLLRLPIHASYLLYLSTFSPWLARTYFRWAIAACRVFAVKPCLLLHPLDFLGRDDLHALAFFPGMNVDGETKLKRLREYLEIFTRAFDVRTVREHVESLANEEIGRARSP